MLRKLHEQVHAFEPLNYASENALANQNHHKHAIEAIANIPDPQEAFALAESVVVAGCSAFGTRNAASVLACHGSRLSLLPLAFIVNCFAMTPVLQL